MDKIKNKKRITATLIYILSTLMVTWNWELFGRSLNQGNGRWRYIFFGILILFLGTYLRSIRTLNRKREKKVLKTWQVIVAALFWGICWHFTLELMFNVRIFSMKFVYIGASVGLASIVFLALLFLFNSMRSAAVVGSIFYFIWALAEFYVERLRGVPVQIQDLYDIPTAMDVAGQYTYTLTGPVLAVLALLMAALVNLFLCDRYILVQNRKIHVMCMLMGLALLIGFPTMLIYGKGFEKLKVSILGSRPVVSFWEYGVQLAFIEGVRCSIIQEPENYDPVYLDEISKQYSMKEVDGSDEKPNIIAIMNESFADIDLLGRLGLAEEIMPNYLALSENTIKGKVMINSIGGGTGKSEYEFLTSQSMHFFQSQITPYVMFAKHLDKGLPSVLKAQGYDTCAIHPFTATNYNRQSAYEILGFDEFLSAKDFKGAKYYSQYVSDESCYDRIFEYVEDHASPVFTFCVTMQNHSPYDFEYFEPNVQLEDVDCIYAEQYLSLIQEADRQIQSLIEHFSECDEKTMIIFFGDHLPSLPNEFWEYVTGVPKSEEDFELQQKYFMTPFFIWTNYDIEEAQDVVLSTNYLGAYALQYADVELPPYYDYLMELRKEIPAFSSLAYWGKDGQLHAFGTEEHIEKLLEIYDQFQYNALFDKKYPLDSFYKLNGEKE